MVQAKDARMDAAGLFGPDNEKVRLSINSGKISDNEYEYDNEEIKGNPASALDHQDYGPAGFDSFSEAMEWWNFSQKHFPQEKVSYAAAGESVYQ